MRRILYLGTDPKEFELNLKTAVQEGKSEQLLLEEAVGIDAGLESRSAVSRLKGQEYEVIHYPVIQIVPFSLEDPAVMQSYADLDKYTHFIFTSKNAVALFFDYLEKLDLTFPSKEVVAVGAVTAAHLARRGVMNPWVAKEETQEGLIALLSTLDLHNAYLFIPKSSLSRPVLYDFLNQAQISYRACNLYDTVAQVKEPRPAWEDYDFVVFTSPSTVRAFFSMFGCLPSQQRCLAIGPVTQRALDEIALGLSISLFYRI